MASHGEGEYLVEQIRLDACERVHEHRWRCVSLDAVGTPSTLFTFHGLGSDLCTPASQAFLPRDP